MPLARITPRPSPLKPSESLKALSERGSKQIAKARRLVDQQRYTEAAIELERALRYDPNHPDIHRTLATLHWQAGNVERARTHAERALEQNRGDAGAHYIMGRCHALQERHVAAMQSFRTALLSSDFQRSGDASALCHYYLAESLVEQRYLAAALDQFVAFEEAVAARTDAEPGPDLAALLRANRGSTGRSKADILEKLGRFAEAAEALAPLVADNSENVALGLRHARLLLRAGTWQTALGAARMLPFDDEPVIALVAEIHERSGHPERIVDDLRARLADRPGDANLLTHLADALMRLHRSGDAIKELQSHLKQNPAAYAVRWRLIDLYVAQARWQDVLNSCAKGLRASHPRSIHFEDRITALSTHPDAAAVLLARRAKDDSGTGSYLRGLLAFTVRRFDDAERWLKQSRALQPDFVPSRVALARTYLGIYRYEEALEAAGRIDSDVPEDASLELVLGEIQERLDDIEKAEAHFRAAIQLDRADTRPMLALAHLYNQSRRQLQSQRQLRVLLEQQANDETARELLAKSYFEDGQIDAAIEQFEELSRRAKTPIVKARADALLATLVHQEETDVYRDALQEAMRTHGEDAQTWLAIAESYSTESQPQAKADALRRALALDPDCERARLGLVDTTRRLLEFERGAHQLEKLMQRRPRRTRWQLSLINMYWTLQRHDDAVNLARLGAQRDTLSDSERRVFRRVLLEALRVAGREGEMIPTVRAFVDAEPDNRDWPLLIADEHLRRERPHEAVKVLEALYARDDEWSNLLALLTALESAKEYDRAAQYLLSRLNDDPENDAASMRLAQVLTSAERFDEALELLRSQQLHTLQRETFQDEELVVLQRAKRYDECLDRIDELMEEVSSLIRAAHEARGRVPRAAAEGRPVAKLPNEPYTLETLYPRRVRLRLWSGVAMIASEQFRSAARQLDGWLEEARDPSERVGYLRQLSFCHRGEQDDDKATKVLGRALLLRPRDAGLNNDVAYGWIDAGQRLEDAERMIRLAVWQNPRNAAFLDTFGWLLYKKGDFVGAKKWLLRSNGARQSDDAVVIDHLADACWRLGHKEEALSYWAEAIEAAAKLPEDAPPNAEMERLRKATPQKIEDVQAAKEPKIAELMAVESEENDEPTPEVVPGTRNSD